MDGDVAAEAAEPGDAEGEAAEAVDLKALDFELSHDLETMSDVCSRDLSVRQVNLIKLALASALYPNVAVADGGNQNRPAPDAVFVTPRKPQVPANPPPLFSRTNRTSLVPPLVLIGRARPAPPALHLPQCLVVTI